MEKIWSSKMRRARRSKSEVCATQTLHNKNYITLEEEEGRQEYTVRHEHPAVSRCTRSNSRICIRRNYLAFITDRAPSILTSLMPSCHARDIFAATCTDLLTKLKCYCGIR